MGADKPQEKFEGTESVRSIGPLWILGESQSRMPDGDPANMIITLGFSPLKGHYVGTWIGSMMNYLWVYKGTMDPTQKILTLEAQGPDMSGDNSQMRNYKDVIEIKTPDHRTLTSHHQDAQGQWHSFMQAHYYRVA